ncbi:MAG: hypothetical protein KDA39_10920 [Hyphomonas sp.]|nr:hypothetical protein [Hyphomonas sp.]
MAESKDAFFEQMYTRLGQLSYVWGQLDHALAVLVYSIFHQHGNPPGDGEIPVSLKRRLRYLRTSVRAFDIEPDIKETFLRVLNAVGSEAVIRNHLVHGAVCEYWIEQDTIEASSLKHTDGLSGYVTRKYTFAEIQAASDRALEITDKIQVAAAGLLRSRVAPNE